MPLPFKVDDGGREAAGFRGKAGDCVVRAVSIASGRPYSEVYQSCADGMQGLARTKRRNATAGKRSARNGVYTNTAWFKRYMASLGFVWTPTMLVGQGCKTHLAPGELPTGRLVVMLSKHATAVIDGVIHDSYDPQRHTVESGMLNGVPYKREYDRCVYGYWRLLNT